MAEEMNEISGQQAADRVAKARMEKSRAEILCAMDCLIHHLNDEDAMEAWLVNGVPDGLSWDVLNANADRYADYMSIAQDMEDKEFEDIVHLFARIVKRECFKTVYEPKTFC